MPDKALPLDCALHTTDHIPFQSKGSLDRLDEKPLDLGPPLPPKVEAGTFGSDLQTPRPGSAGEVGAPEGRKGRRAIPASPRPISSRERPVGAEDQPPDTCHVQVPACLSHGSQGAILRAG